MSKAKTKKPAAKRKTVKRTAPAKKKAAPRKKATTARRPIAKKIGFIVECKKSKTGAWQKLCSATSKSTAAILARAYWNANPTHWVRVTD